MIFIKKKFRHKAYFDKSDKKTVSLTKSCTAFTLVEILVVISIIGLLAAILLPTLSLAREQAKITMVNADLYGISMALECYFTDFQNKYPPTRAGCNPEERLHVYALPQELVDQGYLPKAEQGSIRYAKLEDRFNSGYTYKYIAVGTKYDYFGTPFPNQYLKVPEGFPQYEDGKLIKYDEPSKSPVTWVLISAGPRYNMKILEVKDLPIKDGFPIKKEFRYSTQNKEGVITRMRLKNEQQIGTFSGI